MADRMKWRWRKELGQDEMPVLEREDGSVVCDFGRDLQYYPTEGAPPSEADARLIAAAPDMLEACELALATIGGGSRIRGGVRLRDTIRAAIAKATGKESTS